MGEVDWIEGKYLGIKVGVLYPPAKEYILYVH